MACDVWSKEFNNFQNIVLVTDLPEAGDTSLHAETKVFIRL